MRFIFYVALFHGAVANAGLQPRYSILQGATSQSVATFNVMARLGDALAFDVSGTAPAAVATHFLPGSPFVTFKLRFEGLGGTKRHLLRVWAGGRVVDERVFRMLPRNSGARTLAFGSCMVRQLHNPFMWDTLEREKPDVILLIGDAVYLDRENPLFPSAPENPLAAWTAFARSRETLNLYFWKELRPVLTVWDDHDSGFDNDDAGYAAMPEMRRIYESFFANEEIPGTIRLGPGLAKAFEFAGRGVIMLDGRSYRNLDPRAPLFGREQEEWLFQRLRPGVNFVFNGSQFFGRFIAKDSFELNWPEAFVGFMARLRERADARGATIVFGSGDIHFSEVQRIEPDYLGYETLEITSSSLHSFAFPGHYFFKPSNPRRLRVTGTHNAVLLRMDEQDPYAFKIRSVGWRGNDLFNFDAQIGHPCRAMLASTGAHLLDAHEE